MTKKSQNFFGETIKIIDSPDKKIVGITGIVVDETQNLLIISTKKGIKKLLKNSIIFEHEKIKINGKNMLKRFENRIQR